MSKVRKLKLEELGRLDVESYQSKEKLHLTVIVDNFRSGLNVGSLFRTADAFMIEKVILCGITSTPPHKEILKTAIGANHSVMWEYVNATKDAIEQLKSKDYQIVGIEQTTASIPLAEYDIQSEQKYAIVFGNEVEGLSEESIELVDTFIEIPQYGTKHSLNVSVCAGIVLYTFAKGLTNA